MKRHSDPKLKNEKIFSGLCYKHCWLPGILIKNNKTRRFSCRWHKAFIFPEDSNRDYNCKFITPTGRMRRTNDTKDLVLIATILKFLKKHGLKKKKEKK